MKKEGVVIFLLILFVLLISVSALGQPKGGAGDFSFVSPHVDGTVCGSGGECISGLCQLSSELGVRVCTSTTPTDTEQIRIVTDLPCSELTISECGLQDDRCELETNPSNGQQSCVGLSIDSPEDQDFVQTTTEIVAPSGLTASVSDGNVILTWNPASIQTTGSVNAFAILDVNQITGNVGFFDSIPNFFKSLFGIGTRGTVLTQQDLAYDVWRDNSPISQGVPCNSNSGTCSYTDTIVDEGVTYIYKIGVRAEGDLYYDGKFSNEVSVIIPPVRIV